MDRQSLFEHARRGHFHHPRKHQTTARVHADVLDWRNSQGKGDQSGFHAILRRAMPNSAKSKLFPACYTYT
jgi:uncharacterized protein (DUF4415 family)